MKYVAKSDEMVTEFYLKDDNHGTITLWARTGTVESMIAYINEDGIRLAENVAEIHALPLDEDGEVMLTGDPC